MTNELLPPLSEHQKGSFEQLHKFDMERLQEARVALRQAQKNLDYWTAQEAASSAVAARVMVQGWSDETRKPTSPEPTIVA